MSELNIRNIKKRYGILLAGVLGLLVAGFVFYGLYHRSSSHAIPLAEVSGKIHQLQRKSDRKLVEIASWLNADKFENLKRLTSENLSATYLIYENDSLIFWSDNQIEPQNLKHTDWQFMQLSNVYALTRSARLDSFNIVAYLPLKYNYPYENEELQNVFEPRLGLNKDIGFEEHHPTSANAVFSEDGRYLFSFTQPSYPIFNEHYAIASMLCFFFAFLLLFYLIAHFPLLFGLRWMSFRVFAMLVAAVSVFVSLMLSFNFPDTFFLNKYLTPYHFASSLFLSTLSHLSFFSIALFALIYLFSFYVKPKVGKSRYDMLYQLVLLLLPAIYFLLIFVLFVGVIFNSTVEVDMLRVENFSIVSLLNHFLFLIWGVGFFFLHTKVHKEVLAHAKPVYVVALDLFIALLVYIAGLIVLSDYSRIFIVFYLVLTLALDLPLLFRSLAQSRFLMAYWLVFFAFFVTWTGNRLNQSKKFEKYHTLAENYTLNDPNDVDKLAIALLEDLDKSIGWDSYLKKMVQSPDSVVKANDYVNNYYLRGFWSKYKVRLFAAYPDSDLDMEYHEVASKWGWQVKKTHFSVVDIPGTDMTFLGVFPVKKNNEHLVNYYLEFYPRKYHKSYSFPELLLETQPSIQSQLGLSSARYAYRELLNSSGKFKYRQDAGWIEKRKENYFYQDYNGYRHYIYAPGPYEYSVLSEVNNASVWQYVMYYIYVLLFFVSLSYLIKWVYRVTHRNVKVTHTFSSKFLYSFTILLFLSFVLIFYVSTGFMQQKYQDEHVDKLKQTKTYIQNALQEKYSWNTKLDSTMRNELTFDLQDLSFIYQTDIHVYDNAGHLVASSQMPLFSRGLISQLISPVTYFSNVEDLIRYEHIGSLDYLTAYTDFYNMDYLPIGYIAVPQFLSKELIQEELESFLSVIVHIYLIIIVLFVVLSLLIGRQLSAPLMLLEESLRKIKIGQQNQKIEYKPQDEIGQLVEQYNNMVDELEKNVQLLARSERESAWKTMARQVAHEINNPLTPMKLTIQQLQRRKAMNDGEFDAYFERSSNMLIEQIENLSRIAGSFSSFAKLPEAKFEKVNLTKTLGSVVTLFSNSNEEMAFSFNCPDEEVYLMADREQLIQVFNNILKNAVQAIPVSQSGSVAISLAVDEANAVVTIADNGKGIAHDIKDKLFNPNFTTKSTGMGLGLAISRNIVNLIGGDISFETELGVGTSFKITLPRLK